MVNRLLRVLVATGINKPAYKDYLTDNGIESHAFMRKL